MIFDNFFFQNISGLFKLLYKAKDITKNKHAANMACTINEKNYYSHNKLGEARVTGIITLVWDKNV